MGDIERGTPGNPAANKGNDLDPSCAKLWSVYIAEAEKYDKAIVESWRGDMDGMLIFAGLFSASLTAFIIESYKTLTPDSGDTTAALLAQISKQLAASASGETFQVPTPAVFVIPKTSVVCNTLWFISLGLSLSCALIATLVEQWAREFVQRAEMRPSPVIRARIFSYLYYGLKRFNMHVVVDLVPLLLHMSLILFFVGLVAFLLPINYTLVAVVAALLGIVVAIYCSLTVLPLIYFDCPYRTPLSAVLWRMRQLSLLVVAVLRHDRSQAKTLQSFKNGTMVDSMIHRATSPAAERDRRALCWTVKSLTDDTELEPFLAGIPDALWGSNRRNYRHDHLITALLDDPEVRLGDRIVDLMRRSDSGLLPPEVAFRHKVSCLKALWSICTLSKRGAQLNLSVHALTLLLASWQLRWARSLGNGDSRDRDFDSQLGTYLPAVRAVLYRCILSFSDLRLQRLKKTCEAEITAERMFNLDDAGAELNQELEEFRQYQLYDATYHHTIANLIDEQSVVEAPSWSQKLRFFFETENYWHDVGHQIIYEFLRLSLSSAGEPYTVYEFRSTLKLLQLDFLPSDFPMKYCAVLLEMISGLDAVEDDHQRRHNTDVLGVIITLLFPVADPRLPVPSPVTESRPHVPLDLDIINVLISYIKTHILDPPALSLVLNERTCTQLLIAMIDYLRAGCPRSNDTEATLEAMCGLYNSFSEVIQPEQSLLWDVSLEWLDDTLCILQGLPFSRALPSILSLVKIQTLLILTFRQYGVFQRLEKGKIMRYAPEVQSLSNKLQGLVRKRGLQRLPQWPTNSEIVAPTRSDWDELYSLLSHPLLSERNLGKVSDVDPKFDFGACNDDMEKASQYLNLLAIMNGRFRDAAAVLYAEFLEACSSQTLPYMAVEIMDLISLFSGFNPFFAHPENQMRLANSINTLKQARNTSPDHTRIWEHLILESPILSDALDMCIGEARSGAYDPTALKSLKNALENYVRSIRGSGLILETRVDKLVKDLDALLESPSPPTPPLDETLITAENAASEQ
ncbi:hypothetical protein B0H11DRAFT_2028071 [Mycena galericulata]|nr:hypothetical protein B0H11DRAFT_2028071 [Mycena galericulata]